MPRPAQKPVSSYLDKPLRSLHDTCHELGRDNYGRACLTCSVWDLCVKTQASRLEHLPGQVVARLAALSNPGRPLLIH
jgi:hypothetical protein